MRELGRGSMGVVYQAHDPQIDRLVALKVLRHHLVTTEKFVHRFLQEAKAIGRLCHPSIVTVYDVGRDHGTIYIAMEFVAGDCLDKVMAEKAFTHREAMELGIQVARVIDYAHHNGIVHRNIKPSKIILRPYGQLKITDFGIAHIEDPSATLQTGAGEILGTPAYMSPEQVLGQPVDGRSDIYSLGGVLYELTTGIRPFGGDTLTAVFRAITQELPPDPVRLVSNMSPDLSQIIMKCLRKAPDERFPTGGAMAEALESCLNERKPISPAVPFTRRIARNPGLIFLGILLVAVVVGGLSYRMIGTRVREVAPPFNVELTPYGFLNIRSKPIGAQVFVDGGFKGKTPLQLELPLGKHEVRLTLPDYHDWEAQVELTKAQEIPLLVRLFAIERKDQ
jgi:serine/threonine-protein kinase